jgi:hypothetical protein
VRVSFESHDHARRFGAGRREPHGGQKIQTVILAAGDDQSRNANRKRFVAVVAGFEVNRVLPIHGRSFL